MSLRDGAFPSKQSPVNRKFLLCNLRHLLEIASGKTKNALAMTFETMTHTSLTKRVRSLRPWLGFGSLTFGLLAWQFTARMSGLPSFILPAPADVWSRFLRAAADGSLFVHMLVTLTEILVGLLAGVVIATVLGYLVAKSRLLENLLAPYLVASQAVPLVAIAPLLVIWFGPGMFSKFLICALIVFFPVLVNTVVGVRAVPPALYDLMGSLHATRGQILVHLEVPAALSIFLGGLRIGATLSVIGAVVGELVGADQGLGFLINEGRGQYDTALVFVAIFALVTMALALYGIVAWFERRLLIWQNTGASQL